jgi:hypothetical protein
MKEHEVDLCQASNYSCIRTRKSLDLKKEKERKKGTEGS